MEVLVCKISIVHTSQKHIHQFKFHTILLTIYHNDKQKCVFDSVDKLDLQDFRFSQQ
jgi:hypothetical protein